MICVLLFHKFYASIYYHSIGRIFEENEWFLLYFNIFLVEQILLEILSCILFILIFFLSL